MSQQEIPTSTIYAEMYSNVVWYSAQPAANKHGRGASKSSKVDHLPKLTDFSIP